jgi:3-oxoacyl-[acyl-carrier-protein] synthase-3
VSQNHSYAAITGWGKAIPSKILTNADLEKMVDTSDDWIRTRTGIQERHLLSEGESNLDLSVQAAREALQKAGIEADELDLVIVGTCTPDFLLPSTACLVQDELGASNAAAFDLQAACSGFLYSLSVGTQFINTGVYRKILVIGSETITRFIDFTDRSTCVLFGDGSGAVVLEQTESESKLGLGAFRLGAYGAGGKYLQIPAGGSRRPPSIQTVNQREHFVKMDGGEVFKLAVRSMTAASLEVLERENLTINDIDLFIPHQANLRIIEAVGSRLEIPAEKVWVNIDRYGNTSAASIPISMCEAIDAGRLKPGMKVLVSAFGGGLTWASGVIYW